MRKKGFSLIELLVVVAIIAILSAIGIAAFRNVTDNARDAKRKADVEAITKALENQYNPETGQYPTSLESSFFTGNALPQKPEGGSYEVKLNNNKDGFQICATLDDGGTQYCKQSSQGKYIAAATPLPTVAPTDPPAPTPTPTPVPTADPDFGLQINPSVVNVTVNTPGVEVKAFDITSNYSVTTTWELTDCAISTLHRISTDPCVTPQYTINPDQTQTVNISTVGSTAPGTYSRNVILKNLANNQTRTIAITVTVSAICPIPTDGSLYCKTPYYYSNGAYLDCNSLTSDQRQLLNDCPPFDPNTNKGTNVCYVLDFPVYSSATGGSQFTHKMGVMACPSGATGDTKYTTQIKRRQ